MWARDSRRCCGIGSRKGSRAERPHHPAIEEFAFQRGRMGEALLVRRFPQSHSFERELVSARTRPHYSVFCASAGAAGAQLGLVGMVMFRPTDLPHAMAIVLYPRCANLENGAYRSRHSTNIRWII